MKLAIVLAASGMLLGGCLNKDKDESVKLSNEGTKAYGQKQFTTAIDFYRKAVDRWHDNHVAWYGLAGAYIGNKDWDHAAEAAGKAVEIQPEQAMYNMVAGYTMYEKAVDNAADEQAHRENKKKEEITPDLTAVNFEKPLALLQEAVKENNDLWRAHYYIGRIFRDEGKAKEAATEITKALQSAPTEPAPWIALAELYRRWDYTDEAIAVAEAGITSVPGQPEKTDIWYEVGMGYDDKRNNEKAIEAFTKAIEAKQDNHKALFQRGQAYFRKGDMTNAKRDLEEFNKGGGASVEFAKQQASKMLMDIAAKSAGAGGAPSEKQSPEALVKQAGGGKH
ncbi:MAG TPA: tetratricopeptide repeat protein [Kofleriaceae bacterium]